MLDALKDAGMICKTLFRNGYDAHIVNAPMQDRMLRAVKGRQLAVDLACEADGDIITKIFPDARESTPQEKEDTLVSATLEQNGVLFRFYRISMKDAEHPELSLMKVTPTMLEMVRPEERQKLKFTRFGALVARKEKGYEGFEPMETGAIKIAGLPDETLRHNYLLAIRALRFAANFDLPIEENTRLAILRAASRVLDYVPARDIMDEWRLVAAENMHVFVKHLFDVHILQGLIPEVAALSCVPHIRNKKTREVEDLFTHTLRCMQHYPEGAFHHDWLGTMAVLFHDVGKTYTAEYVDGEWTFYQHHRVGAQVTRKILRRLHMDVEDMDLICHLVRNHMRFSAQMTDRGLRRFMALDEYPRLIEICRADIESRGEAYTSFNHNMKYLNRAETPVQMIEPLLNGNEIMRETHLAPGPQVGQIRDALLKAQIAGDVTDMASAIAFVKSYATD